MWHTFAFDRMRTDALALELNAERAGRALACAYTSSAEFDAAVIRAKRAAGRYGSRRVWRSVVLIGATLGMLLIIAAALV
jgi:hypothetical protein